MAVGLNVNEIFLSIQGEGTRAGRPCMFVRLAGCNLRCRWCDTAYAYDEGTPMSVGQVLDRVGEGRCSLVAVTGGEPMLQEAAGRLLADLCDRGYEVLLHTNGSVDVTGVDERVIRCLDVKCPGSGQADSVWLANLKDLRPRDELKFVLANRADYEYACGMMQELGLFGRCPAIFSPVAGELEPAELARWILADGLEVRLGLQLHKIIWPGVERGV